MSQKVKITKVSVKGASPFIGLFDVESSENNLIRVARWSRNPDDLMHWLSDGYRYRFNQLRSRRSKWEYRNTENDTKQTRELVPIGQTVDERSLKATRSEESFIASIPSTILEHPTRTESIEWFSAAVRRKTLKAKNGYTGTMPSFRKKGKDDLTFGCWYKQGQNAVFHKTGRKTGIVTITGQNSKMNRLPSEKAERYFAIRIHVRVTEPIRKYTSITINWTTKNLIFVNLPLPLENSRMTGAAVGLDAGVAHAYSSSDNEVFDLPIDRLKTLENKIKFHQKRMSKSRKVAQREDRNYWESKGYQLHKVAVNHLNKQITNIRTDAWHKITTHLVLTYDYIVIEELNLKNMMKSASGTVDKPGTNVAQKRGLNRSIQRMALGVAKTQLDYKTKVNGKTLASINPHYTSQQCSACSYTAKENRKSQAIFLCLKCNHSENADVNAAKNILQRGLDKLEQNNRDGLFLTGSKHRTDHISRDGFAAALNRKPVRD